MPNDEKGVYPIQTLGGIQTTTFVNEPGLYSLMLGSRKLNIANSDVRQRKGAALAANPD